MLFFLPSPFSRFNVYREAKKGKETSIGGGMTHVVQTRSNFNEISNKKLMVKVVCDEELVETGENNRFMPPLK